MFGMLVSGQVVLKKPALPSLAFSSAESRLWRAKTTPAWKFWGDLAVRLNLVPRWFGAFPFGCFFEELAPHSPSIAPKAFGRG